MLRVTVCFLLALLAPGCCKGKIEEKCVCSTHNCSEEGPNKKYADGFFCYNCTSHDGYNCTMPQKCAYEVNSCITIAREEDTGAHGIENTTYEKRCNYDDRLCNQFYGLVAGDFHMHWNSSCCRSNLCNDQNVTDMDIVQNKSEVPNGIRCSSCFARGTNVCLNATKVNCTGQLDQCIHFATIARKEEYKDQQVDFKGCATKNMCSMGATALFAAGRQVYVKSILCSRAPGVPSQHSLALSAMAGLLFLAYQS